MRRSPSHADPRGERSSSETPSDTDGQPTWVEQDQSVRSDASPATRLRAKLPSAPRENFLKAGVKSLLERFDIYVLRMLPRGVSVSHDLRRALCAHHFDLIFDVGANVGQSTRRYLRDFPKSRIVSFEPCSPFFAKLEATFGRMQRVTCERLALGSAEGEATLVRTRNPMMHHLAVAGDTSRPEVEEAGMEQVLVTTVDRYCDNHGIEHIDFLKIDTEGHDFEVVVGADRMLAEGRITALQCECSVSPENTFHVGFDAMRSHLEVKGYRLFGVYEQAPEWIRGAPNLRRVDAVFICPRQARADGSRRT
jgi:FkbM family methyltransferase